MIEQGRGLDGFVRQLESVRKTVPAEQVQQSIALAASEMEGSGIVATADISNGAHTLPFKSRSNHYFHTLIEVFGSDPAWAATIHQKALGLKQEFENRLPAGRVSMVPHATYSLSEELFRLVATEDTGTIKSIHHQENEDENHFFRDGSGPIALRRKAFNPHLPPYSGTSKRPMESIAGFFNPDHKLLLVHNTVSQPEDITFVQQYFKQPYWCFCPNANLYIENRLPQPDYFRQQQCVITLGTDSLASNYCLSLLSEMKTISKHFAHIPFAELLQWATLNGARFLGLEQTLGSFDAGKSPGVVLIENINTQQPGLLAESTSTLLIPALP
jgi:cytosine/adenosine deaminase-related metal-dependent hydrolase